MSTDSPLEPGHTKEQPEWIKKMLASRKRNQRIKKLAEEANAKREGRVNGHSIPLDNLPEPVRLGRPLGVKNSPAPKKPPSRVVLEVGGKRFTIEDI